jgi:hypothetical protein
MQGGEPFPAEEHQSGADNFQFQQDPYTDSFTGMVKVFCQCANFGITVGHDQINGHGIVKFVSPGGSISKIWGNPKTTNNKTFGAFILWINGKELFSKDGILSAFADLQASGATQFDIEFAYQGKLMGKELWKVIKEHDDLFNPDAVDEEEEHILTLTFKDICAIASIWHPDVDFSRSALPTDELRVIVHAIQFHAIMLEEQDLGSFTCCKHKKLDTQPLWAAGEQNSWTTFTPYRCMEIWLIAHLAQSSCILIGSTQSSVMDSSIAELL